MKRFLLIAPSFMFVLPTIVHACISRTYTPSELVDYAKWQWVWYVPFVGHFLGTFFFELTLTGEILTAAIIVLNIYLLWKILRKQIIWWQRALYLLGVCLGFLTAYGIWSIATSDFCL